MNYCDIFGTRVQVPVLGWLLTDYGKQQIESIPALEARIKALEEKLEERGKVPWASPAPAPAWNSYETYVEKVCAEEFQEEEGEESGLAELFSKAD